MHIKKDCQNECFKYFSALSRCSRWLNNSFVLKQQKKSANDSLDKNEHSRLNILSWRTQLSSSESRPITEVQSFSSKLANLFTVQARGPILPAAEQSELRLKLAGRHPALSRIKSITHKHTSYFDTSDLKRFGLWCQWSMN